MMFGLVTPLLLRLGHRTGRLRTAPIWLVVLATAGAIGGAGGLGLLLRVSVLVAKVPQLLVARREQNLGGLSLRQASRPLRRSAC